MSLRAFRGSDGCEWTVWLIRAGSAGRVPGTPAQWLAFQNAEATERRRLLEIPDNWETLSDDRLDLLRRIAEPVALRAQRHTLPGGIPIHPSPSDDAED